MCSLSLEPKVIFGMSQARQNSRLLCSWAGTEQPTARAAATVSPFRVRGLEPGGESNCPSLIRSLQMAFPVSFGLNTVWWVIFLLD